MRTPLAESLYLDFRFAALLLSERRIFVSRSFKMCRGKLEVTKMYLRVPQMLGFRSTQWILTPS